MTSSIANETVDHSKNREPFSFYKFITNKYFLNVVSIVLFLALWDYVAKEKIFRDSLARPLEVVDQLYRLTYMKPERTLPATSGPAPSACSSASSPPASSPCPSACSWP